MDNYKSIKISSSNSGDDRLLTVICCFTIANEVRGQDLKQKKDSLVSYKYDLSLDLYQLFSNGGANIMFRYGSWEKGALRVQLGSSYIGKRENESSKFDTIPQLPNAKFKYEAGKLNFRIGYEFHKSINKHQVFYGSDIGYSYHFADNNLNIGVVRYSTISMSPFFGIKYRILPRLSMSMEMAVSLYYYAQRGFSPLNIKVSEDEELNLSFQPLRFINVSYHF